MVCGPELSAPRHDFFVKKWGPKPKTHGFFPNPLVSLWFLYIISFPIKTQQLISFDSIFFWMFWDVLDSFPYVFLCFSYGYPYLLAPEKPAPRVPRIPRIPARSAVSHGGDEVRADAENVGGVGPGDSMLLVMVEKVIYRKY